MRKIGLYILLGLGLFCMMAAILRRGAYLQCQPDSAPSYPNVGTLTLSSSTSKSISAMWSIREDFVAVFVGQAPMVYPLFNRKFWEGV